MKKEIFVVITLFFCSLIGCNENPPSMPDGESNLTIIAYGNISQDSVVNYRLLSNAKVILVSEYGMFVRYTDSTGVLKLDGIPSAVYSISVRKKHPVNNNIYLVGTQQSIEVIPGKAITDTIHAEPVLSYGIAINEIYSAGPVNNQFFFYDQFLELYNSSDEVKYLDGMTVMRISGNNDGGKGPGADEGDNGSIDGVTYIFQFPGTPGGTQYPFQPHTFLTIAVKAMDHTKLYKTSLDLSHADWEFYNQYSPVDMDNPNVPNLSNLKSSETADFLMSLTSDVIAVGSGFDQDWKNGVDIKTVIDAVEYQPSATSPKTLDNRVDRGYVIAPPKYSGKSIRRREPGVDTNDGTMDWEVATPTPGKP